MPQQLDQQFRAATAMLSRCRCIVGTAIALFIFVLCVLSIPRSAEEYAATARLILRFHLTNGVLLNPRQYATNGFGWNPVVTEQKFINSEFFLGEAQNRLNSIHRGSATSSGSPVRPTDKPEYRLETAQIAGGIRIRAIGTDPRRTMDLANAAAEVYRDERNHLSAPPPGCRALSIAISKWAQPASRFPYFAHLCRIALGAGALGLAVALLFSRRAIACQKTLLSTFLFWLLVLFGLGLLATSLTRGVALCGATLAAFLVASGAGCLALVAAQNPAVSARFLRYAYWAICLLFVGYAILLKLILPESFQAAVRVRINVQHPTLPDELPITYDPRFIATECALIESGLLLNDVVRSLDLCQKWGIRYGAGQPLKTSEAVQMLAGRFDMRAVPNTSLIEIRVLSDRRDEAATIANVTAGIYRDYWNRRSATNREIAVKVTLLNDADSQGSQARTATGRYYAMVTTNFLSALFVLCGMLCAAWLARNPVQLYYIPLCAVAYFMALGLAFVTSAFSPDTYGAWSLVRIWPPVPASSVPTGSERTEDSEAMMRRESERAMSPTVLARIERMLKSSAEFEKQQRAWWDSMKDSGKDRWLKMRLKVVPQMGTYVLRFEASAENPADAARIANAAAAAYCELRGATDEPQLNRDKMEPEIIETSFPRTKPEAKSNPLADGLQAGCGNIGWFLFGTAIGYLGFLVGNVRRAKAVALPYAGEGASGVSLRRW